MGHITDNKTLGVSYELNAFPYWKFDGKPGNYIISRKEDVEKEMRKIEKNFSIKNLLELKPGYVGQTNDLKRRIKEFAGGSSNHPAGHSIQWDKGYSEYDLLVTTIENYNQLNVERFIHQHLKERYGTKNPWEQWESKKGISSWFDAVDDNSSDHSTISTLDGFDTGNEVENYDASSLDKILQNFPLQEQPKIVDWLMENTRKRVEDLLKTF